MHIGCEFRQLDQFPGCGIAANVKFVDRLQVIQGDVSQINAEFIETFNDPVEQTVR